MPEPEPPFSSADFLSEATRLYRDHVGLFFRISLPAAVLAYLCFTATEYQWRGILYRSADPLHRPLLLLFVGVVRFSGFVASWILGCFAYAAITVAVRRLLAGETLGMEDAYAPVRSRVGAFFRITLLLGFVCWLGFLLAMLVGGIGTAFIVRRLEIWGQWVYIASVVLFALLSLAVSKLSLSIPAVVLDRTPSVKALFLSDELTQGRWIVLALLVVEGVVGAYISGSLPYWFAGYIMEGEWPYVFLWLVRILSLVIVAFVQPAMFVGLALLYERRLGKSITTQT